MQRLTPCRLRRLVLARALATISTAIACTCCSRPSPSRSARRCRFTWSGSIAAATTTWPPRATLATASSSSTAASPRHAAALGVRSGLWCRLASLRLLSKVLDEEGNEIGTIKEGDFFGQDMLYATDRVFSASVRALTFCNCFYLSRADFLETLYKALQGATRGRTRRKALMHVSVCWLRRAVPQAAGRDHRAGPRGDRARRRPGAHHAPAA